VALTFQSINRWRPIISNYRRIKAILLRSSAMAFAWPTATALRLTNLLLPIISNYRRIKEIRVLRSITLSASCTAMAFQ
jgi:hypothetical protein